MSTPARTFTTGDLIFHYLVTLKYKLLTLFMHSGVFRHKALPVFVTSQACGIISLQTDPLRLPVPMFLSFTRLLCQPYFCYVFTVYLLLCMGRKLKLKASWLVGARSAKPLQSSFRRYFNSSNVAFTSQCTHSLTGSGTECCNSVWRVPMLHSAIHCADSQIRLKHLRYTVIFSNNKKIEEN